MLSTLESDDEVHLPNYGIFLLSITQAVRIIALDGWFSDLIPGMKSPNRSEGDAEVAYLRGVNSLQGSPNFQEIIEKLFQQEKLEEASATDLAIGFRKAITEIERLKREMAASSQFADLDNSVRPKERRSMLSIMATLCSLANVKYEERAEAKKIEIESIQIGVSVSDDTIRKYFEEMKKVVKKREKEQEKV
jgi:tellurite resistance protein